MDVRAVPSSPFFLPSAAGERKGARLRDCFRRRHGQAPWERNKPKTRPRGARRTSAFHLSKPSPSRAPFGRFSAVGLLVQIEIDAGATALARRDGAG